MKGYFGKTAIIAFIGLTALASCSDTTEQAVVKDAVLRPGETVEARNKNGKVRITYVSSLRRKYEWDGKSRVVKMIAREEPFLGELGLYEPADSWGLNPFEVRVVVDEAIRNFENEEQIRSALIEGSAIMDWVYTGDGLVAGYAKTPARRQVNIDVWQILLKGKKPKYLSGARPESIRVIKQQK